MSKTEKHDTQRSDVLRVNTRRAFLRGSAMLGAGAAVAATTPGIAAPLPEVEQQTAAEPERKGYQLTEHVAAYYRNAAS